MPTRSALGLMFCLMLAGLTMLCNQSPTNNGSNGSSAADTSDNDTTSGQSGLSDTTSDGYTLFAPNGSRYTYLIDMNGNTVHSWSHTRSGGYSVYLLENGHIMRTAEASNSTFGGGGSAGYVQEIDWNGNVVWEYCYSSSTYLAHHDIEPMPNGNVLIIAWEIKSATQAKAAGSKQSSTLWPDHVVEVNSSSQIVWQWHAWDHLVQDYDSSKPNYGVVAEHPELLDLNLRAGSGGPGGGGDWLHMNGISYNPELDQIAITSHYMNEVYVIDHSTTTAEAASHSGGKSGKGGDILYRWGCPSNYDVSGTQYLCVTHCAFWIPSDCPGAGNLMIFNNGTNSRKSGVYEIQLPLQSDGTYRWTTGQCYEPTTPTWSYTGNSSFYSSNQGCCQRLPNGNTLITDPDNGHLFEVNSAGQIQWEYTYKSLIARSLRYPKDYSGLSKLTPSTSSIHE
ncbi:MAG: aryl-sulfate sulfotransferase [Candidatus Delongbacteria bacterium]|nr:aryl-sulfate sulfotransferase [Candidatus Delongbacteria bacterium]